MGMNVGTLLTVGPTRRIESPDGDGVDKRAASRIVLKTSIMNNKINIGELGLKAPSIRIPTIAAVHGLDG